MCWGDKNRTILCALVVPPLIPNKKAGQDVHASERMEFRRRHIEMLVPLDLLGAHVPLAPCQSTCPLAGLSGVENVFYLGVVVRGLDHIFVHDSKSYLLCQRVSTNKTLPCLTPIVTT